MTIRKTNQVHQGVFDPIFIFGLAHSGKTEVGRLLTQEAGVEVLRRGYFWRDHFERFGDLRSDRMVSRAADALAADRSVPLDASQLQHAVEHFLDESGPRSLGRLLGWVQGQAVEDFSQITLIQLGSGERVARRLLTDLPQARAIHLIRDPRSLFGGSDSDRTPGRLGWDVARWAESAEVASEHQLRFRTRYAVLTFEELVTNPMGAIDRVNKGIGTRFETPVDVPFDSDTKVKRLSVGKAHSVEALAGSHLTRLGYDPASGGKKVAPSAADRFAFALRSRRRLP